MTLTSIPVPIVTWETVVSTNDPTREPSRAQIRTLRKNGRVSDGLQVPMLRHGRAAGSHTYHSALFALALKADQADDEIGAASLRRHGTAIEERFADGIRGFLSQNTLGHLVEAPFYRLLVGETLKALGEWEKRGRMDVVFAVGRVRNFSGESVLLEVRYQRGAHPTGDLVDVDLPRSLADRSGLRQGDPVWIFRQAVGSAAVVDLLPAVALSDVLEVPHDGIDADEVGEGLAYLTTGGGSPPSTEEARFLRARHGRATPRRVVRPAG